MLVEVRIVNKLKEHDIFGEKRKSMYEFNSVKRIMKTLTSHVMYIAGNLLEWA